ncbi:hypothetical protein BC831DRAFT_456701 [Entophlyctis helioformis]|nr:hypothetical protein BC831DRAFT_456701 [Entophlyctis helioformis]
MGQHSLAGRVLQGRRRGSLLMVACSRPSSRPAAEQRGGRTEGRLQTGKQVR